MARTYYDDGTFLDQDALGNVTGYSDTTGAVFQPDTSIANSFLRAISGTLSSAINQAFAPKPVQAPAVQSPMNPLVAQLGQIFPLLLLGGAAFLAYRSFK